MPEYKAPGVFIEEIERGPRPIEGVPTSTAAFLGHTERGPLHPRLVTSYGEYVRWFGGVFAPDQYMPHAVAGFFANGGTRLYVSRIVGLNAASSALTIGPVTIEANGPGAGGDNIWVRMLETPGQAAGRAPGRFTLRVACWASRPRAAFDPFEPANATVRPRPEIAEQFDDLSADPLSPDYFVTRLTDAATRDSVSALVTVRASQTGRPLKLSPPASGGFLTGGSDGTLPLTAADFEGKADPALGRMPQGLTQLELEEFDDVALVYAPHPPNQPSEIARLLVAHCESRRFRFAVVDGPNSDPAKISPRDPPVGGLDTPYAAFYAPWLVVADPSTAARITVPPGGHVLGVYARVDTERGVFTAPANEEVRGALGVAFEVNDRAQEPLSSRGVNIIRTFPSRGIRVWGSRTLSSDNLWKYVPVRRLFIFLERSIDKSTQWVVFEPNDERLWARVTDTIRQFLRAQWRTGALVGTTEQEAFFVRCDRTTMTQDDILNGRLICEIGVAEVKAAEFVIFRLFQQTAEPKP